MTLSVNSDTRFVLYQPGEQKSYQLDGICIILSGNTVAVFMPIPTFLLAPEGAQEFTTVLVRNSKQGITDGARVMEDTNNSLRKENDHVHHQTASS